MLIVVFVIVKGLFSFKFSMLSLHYTTENVSMGPAIVTTVITVLMAILIASPIGIFTAVYENIIWLDADFQHPPKYINQFIFSIRKIAMIITIKNKTILISILPIELPIPDCRLYLSCIVKKYI